MKRYTGQFAHRTDCGRIRISNEDQANVLTNERGDVLLLVCDGMGGQNKGDYASKTAMDFVSSSFSSCSRPSVRWLYKTIRKANRALYDESDRDPKYSGMGTTLCAVLIQGQKMVIANVGDSRAYSYSEEDGLLRLTKDQAYVSYLLRTGQISEQEALTHPDRHVLMNALGIYASASMDIETKPYRGQAILLCTDGLYNNLSEMEMRAILNTDDRPDQKVKSLIMDANNNGGSDNIGIAYWEVLSQ